MGASIFVGNLSHRTTEDQLKNFFSSWGTVASVRIPRDRRTGRSNGFGLVEYASQELAELALAVFNGRELGGRVLRLKRATEDGDRSPGSHPERPAWSRAARLRDEVTESRHALAAVGFDDYASDHGSHKHRGKHGSDRKRSRGTRRVID